MDTTPNISRNAVLLFSKPPIPGLVKTRLTKGRGGRLSPEQAAEFFRCSLLDVTDLVMVALEDLEAASTEEREREPQAPERLYDFFISTTPASSVEPMRQLFEQEGEQEGGWPRPIHILCDRGASFDEHFDDAFAQLFAQGYDNVLAIGGDMPALPREHLIDGFKWLDYLAAQSPDGSALVLAPCQQSGVSIVGQTRTTPLDSRGVYYNLNGTPALDAYTEKLRLLDIPSAYLSPVSDIDGDSDLAHAISCLNAIAEASRHQPDVYLARRVLEWIDRKGLKASAPPNDEFDPRDHLDSEHLDKAS
jgi:glycosyltransferase A (GT-A) superfamily protein (DUF2064 family)